MPLIFTYSRIHSILIDYSLCYYFFSLLASVFVALYRLQFAGAVVLSVLFLAFFAVNWIARESVRGGSFLISKSYWSQDQGLDANKPEYKIDLDVCVQGLCMSFVLCYSCSDIDSQFQFTLAFVSLISRSLPLFHRYALTRTYSITLSPCALNLGSFNYILKLQYHLHVSRVFLLHFDVIRWTFFGFVRSKTQSEYYWFTMLKYILRM